MALARATAVDGPDGTNWPAVLGEEAELLHWCHGAPGVVGALCRVPAGRSAELDALLFACLEPSATWDGWERF